MNDDNKQENFISTSGQTPTQSYFNITPQNLTEIVTYYKERDENFLDLKYFTDHDGTDELLNTLKTDKTTGISSEEGRAEHFGSNRIFRKPPPKFCEFVLEALSDKMIIILIICAFLEVGISLYYMIVEKDDNVDWIDGVSIVIAVFIVVSVGAITDYKKEMKFQELNDLQNETTKYNVTRNGEPIQITSDELLVGDLIKINYGDILPADMMLVEGNGLKIDESSLTGESNAVTKKPYEKCKEEYDNGSSKPSSNILLSGTNVIEGVGSAIIIAVGANSQKGIIRSTIDNAQEDNKTPLEAKLDKIADLIGYFGLGSAIVTFIALTIRSIIEYIKDKDSFSIGNLFKTILHIVILCVAIIVVAIPEGLPLAVTLSLAFSIKKLMDNNNLVRKMHACETMGGANYICTDKTGTLTQNLMYITNFVCSNDSFLIKQNEEIKDLGVGKKKKAEIESRLRQDHTEVFKNEKYWEVVKTAIGLNVDCTIKNLDTVNINGDTESYETKNKTDKGFIEFLYQFKTPIGPMKERFLKNQEDYKVFPFDSKKKRMTVYIKNKDFPTGYRLYTKGGAENAMPFSDRYINKETGEVEELTEEIINYVNNEIDTMNKKMMRTLYICYRDIMQEEYENCNEMDINGLLPDQKNLVFIGIVGLRDSLRKGVPESVKKCHRAGVQVIMVTGDNLITATAIAKECNIFPEKIDLDHLRERDVETNPNDTNDPSKKNQHIADLLRIQPYAMTGNSFYAAIGGLYCEVCGADTNLCKCPKSEAEANELARKSNATEKKKVKSDAIRNFDNFIKISNNLLVMARSQPIHKYALVLGLKKLEHVVAVTGDGTNDAPALSKSDVGLAMADGTDIAKEASDIIIMDNNFTSIVVAIIYGRSIYENIRKFLQFQLTVNFGACILVFLCACIGNESPLESIQMLWVNMIMDSLGSLALATEPPYDQLLERAPTNRKESIINGRMWKHISIQSLFELSVLLMLYLIAPTFIPEDKDDILKSMEELQTCFGTLPGNVNFDKDNAYILYGNKDKWSEDIKIINETICLQFSSDSKIIQGNLHEAYDKYTSLYGSTTHMTFIFNTFVMYSLFNQVNCRMIDDSLNTFKRISKGLMFILVTLFELAIQIVLVEYGNKVFHCVQGGLSLKQWGYSIAFASVTFVVNFITKLIPLEKLIDPWTKPKQNEEDSEKFKQRITVSEMVSHASAI